MKIKHKETGAVLCEGATSGTADDDGQYTFIFRWEEDEEDRG